MRERITYNNKAAFNAISHKNRCEIEKEIAEYEADFPEEIMEDCTGIFLTKRKEKMPVFHPVGSCERVISRNTSALGLHSGARIVLTKDNHGHRATGLGGAGATKCEAIDIVAGSLSCAKEIKDDKTQSRANFAEDGARIYLTERGDINSYFATAASTTSKVHHSSLMKSGIGIKADHTLVIGRERVRILAGVSKYDGGERLVTGPDVAKPVIEIGATSAEVHHPAVLGNNLVKYLKKVNEQMNKINAKITNLEIKFLEYKFAMALHQHQGAGVGAIVTFPDPVQAGAEFMQEVPDTINNITKTVTDQYNKIVADYKYFGMPNIGLEGSSDEKLLSSTVYLGE